jgi:hypothetical protein
VLPLRRAGALRQRLPPEGTGSVTVRVFVMLDIYFVSVNYVFVTVKLVCVCVKLLKI